VKYWSLLFGLVAVLAVAAFVYAPFDDDWWLPSYRATNAEALATLEGLDSRIDEEIATLETIEDLDPQVVGQQVGALLDWLGRQGARLDRVARQDYLTNRTRLIQGQRAEASAALTEVRSALASGDQAAIDAAVGEATIALGRLDESASEALAEVMGPSGSLREPVSSAAHQVDHLYILILAITGITFVGVMVAMVYALWRYAASPDRRADYYHGSQRLEVIWTIIPAAILIFIALYQLGDWADIKFQNTWPDVDPAAQVTARQFQWKIRYPAPTAN